MSSAGRKFVIGLLLFLAGGSVIGWIYDRPLVGLLSAVLLALIWQVRQLLTFDRALRTDNFDEFRSGEGIWEQIFSKFQFERDRGIRRKASYRRLLKEIRKSTNAMPDGAVILDSTNEIIVCNRAAKELAGLKRRKDRGQRIENILRDPEIARLVNEAPLGSTAEIPSPVIDGNWLNCRIVPYGGDQKLLVLRDISERVRMSKMRSNFVANASHELRSPLTVIGGYLDALADDDQLPSTWSTPVSQMRKQASRMKQILGEMLELSRLESSGPAMNEEAVDIVALIDLVRQDFQKPGTARIVRNNESTAELLGVRTEIESVIVNLLSNAIRYTPPDGEITITWRSDAGGADLIVADTGEGIDAADIPRLTERFFRVQRGRSSVNGGVGLGLAIVKHILARHEASLEISSEPGSGSRFLCHFPTARVVATPPVSLSQICNKSVT